MSDLPLGKLAELRSREHVPSRRRLKRDIEPEEHDEKVVAEPKKKRKSGEPVMMSTKIPLSRKRVVVHDTTQKFKPRDPRFEGMSGGVNVEEVEKHFGFVGSARAEEIKALEELLKQTTDELDREGIVERIRLLREQDRILSMSKDRHELSVRVKSRIRKLSEESGRHIRVNKKKIKEIEMDERFKRLEEKGQVDKFMKGKRKKLQQRNKKLIPVSKK